MVEACVLIRTERGKFLEIVQSIKQLKGVKDAYPVLGRFDVVVHVSVSSEKELGNVVMKIGNLSGVVFTETLVEVEV
ncbi:MAG: Lrp/AsnC ligand binding domain-containing protein [Nitrososphaeria archaeon]